MTQPERIGVILAKNQRGRSPALIKSETVCHCGRTFYTWSGATECNACQFKAEQEKVRQEMLIELPKRQEEMRLEWLEACGIPPTFSDKRFGNYEKAIQPKAYKTLSEFDYKAGGSLLLLSPGVYGVGKTHLVCALLHKVIDETESAVLHNDLSIRFRNCPVCFVTENALLRRIRNTYNRVNLKVDDENYTETEQEVYQELSNVPLLVIDDVGKVRSRDLTFTQGVYFNIIDDRYSEGMPIILTTNLDYPELEAHIGGACADRLREMCGDNFIKMSGKSYRQKNVSTKS